MYIKSPAPKSKQVRATIDEFYLVQNRHPLKHLKQHSANGRNEVGTSPPVCFRCGARSGCGRLDPSPAADPSSLTLDRTLDR